MTFANTFRALGDPARRKILLMLKGGKMSAGEIAEKFEMSAPTISYHISQLKKADLIKEEKVKNFIYYELNTSVFEDIMLWLKQFQEDDPEGGLNDGNEKKE